MDGDALVSARFIRQPIGSNDDIENAFDEITYSKGAAVIAMLRALRRRPSASAPASAATSSRARTAPPPPPTSSPRSAPRPGYDVAPAFSTFLDQPGVPLVTAALDCDGRDGAPRVSVRLSQQRYLPLGSAGAPPARWQIPVCVRWGAGKAEGRACTLLRERERDAPVARRQGRAPTWIVANDGAAGYYVAGDPDPRGHRRCSTPASSRSSSASP